MSLEKGENAKVKTSENESDNEFYDAEDDFVKVTEKLTLKEETGENESEGEEEEQEQENIEDCSENSDFDSELKENQEDKNSRDESKPHIPLHERLNKEKSDTKSNVVDEEEVDDDESKNDPFYVNEAELEKEQENLTEEEKQQKLKEAQEFKNSGNVFFKEEKYLEALEEYTKALRCCSTCFNKERAIFYSNRAICYFKMKENKKCINECTKSINLDTTFVKPLLRRAECNYLNDEKLDEVLADYKKLSELEPTNHIYKQKCYELEEKIKDRNEKLKTEMMGKLKDLGNMVLKPFGLSTNNFQFVQDESTGSYSVNFKQ